MITPEDIQNSSLDELFNKITINSIDVNKYLITKNGESYTLLHLAVISNDLDKVKMLRERCGAKINVATPESKTTPLHSSVLVDDIEIMKYLLLFGADVDAYDSTGANAVYYACLEKQYKRAYILCVYGSDIEQKDSSGDSALNLLLEHFGGYKTAMIYQNQVSMMFYKEVPNGCRLANFYYRMKEKCF
jgi:ankyrin repeat protein